MSTLNVKKKKRFIGLMALLLLLILTGCEEKKEPGLHINDEGVEYNDNEGENKFNLKFDDEENEDEDY